MVTEAASLKCSIEYTETGQAAIDQAKAKLDGLSGSADKAAEATRNIGERSREAQGGIAYFGDSLKMVAAGVSGLYALKAVSNYIQDVGKDGQASAQSVMAMSGAFLSMSMSLERVNFQSAKMTVLQNAIGKVASGLSIAVPIAIAAGEAISYLGEKAIDAAAAAHEMGANIDQGLNVAVQNRKLIQMAEQVSILGETFRVKGKDVDHFNAAVAALGEDGDEFVKWLALADDKTKGLVLQVKDIDGAVTRYKSRLGDLTKEQKANIEQLKAWGYSNKEIADKLGLTTARLQMFTKEAQTAKPAVAAIAEQFELTADDQERLTQACEEFVFLLDDMPTVVYEVEQAELDLAQASHDASVNTEGLDEDTQRLLDTLRVAPPVVDATKKAFHDWLDSIPSSAQVAEEAMESLLSNISNDFGNIFYDVLTGKGVDFEDFFKRMMDNVADYNAKILQNMLDQWVKFMAEAKKQGEGDYWGATKSWWNSMSPQQKSKAGGAAAGAAFSAVYANQSEETQYRMRYTQMGVQYGSQFGLVGAAIGLIAGAIVDSLVEETQKRIAVSFSHGTPTFRDYGIEDSSAMREMDLQLKQAWSNLQNQWDDIFGMMDMSFYDSMNAITSQIAADNAETLADYTAEDSTGMKPWADNWFDESTWLESAGGIYESYKRFLADELPREMFNLIANFLGEGMSNLGVADDKIRALLQYWGQELDGSALTESVKRYIANIVQMMEAFEFFQKSGSDLLGMAESAVSQSALGVFDEYFSAMGEMAEAFRYAYDFEDQQAKAAQLNEMMATVREAEIQYLQQLYQIQQQLNESVDAQLRQLGRTGWSAEQIIAADQGELADLMDALAGATSAEEGAGILQDIQSLINEIMGAAGENGSAYASSLAAMLEQARDMYNALVDEQAQALADRNASFYNSVDDILDTLLNGSLDIGAQFGVTEDACDDLANAALMAANALYGVAGEPSDVTGPYTMMGGFGEGPMGETYAQGGYSGAAVMPPIVINIPPMNVTNHFTLDTCDLVQVAVQTTLEEIRRDGTVVDNSKA